MKPKSVERKTRHAENSLRERRSLEHRCGSTLAFTLTELLAVIGMISVLVALVFPVLHSGIRQARRGHCISNLRQLHLRHSLHLEDASPEVAPLPRLFKCASDGRTNLISYNFIRLQHDSTLIDSKPFHAGYHVAFGDGHVEFRRTNQFSLSERR